ncbi:hypothetical protein ACOME3_000834 [Neoechinorhynchus agilis]
MRKVTSLLRFNSGYIQGSCITFGILPSTVTMNVIYHFLLVWTFFVFANRCMSFDSKIFGWINIDESSEQFPEWFVGKHLVKTEKQLEDGSKEEMQVSIKPKNDTVAVTETNTTEIIEGSRKRNLTKNMDISTEGTTTDKGKKKKINRDKNMDFAKQQD